MKLVSQDDALKLLDEFNPTYPQSRLYKTRDEVASIDGVDYPLILKIDSPDIVHKSDAGMVQLGIKDKDELLKRFDAMQENLKKNFPSAYVNNYLIQEQIVGKEIIIGMKRDPVFGPAIMFGLGGIFVEVLKDVSFRVAPVTKKEANEMIREIKAFKILEGVRGEGSVNIDSIAELIVMVSKLSVKYEMIEEIDFNPVIVNNKAAYLVDVRILKGDHN